MTNEIKRNIEKGIALINESLVHFDNDDIYSAFKAYEEAGKYLKEAKKRSLTNEGKISMVYGGNRNFGMIYKIFESNTRELLKNKNEAKKLNKIINMIKENKVLRNEFSVYNALTNPINVTDSREYVNEVTSLIRHYSPKTIRENNEKLINLFKECNLNENISVNDNEVELYEGIEYMLLNKKNFNNINEYSRIQNRLCEYVEENKTVLNEKRDIDTIYNEKVNEMVAKHDDILTEDEIRLIQDVENPSKARKMFETYKREAIECLRKEIGNGVDSDSWKTILEDVEKKEYIKENALSDIAEFIDIKNELSD